MALNLGQREELRKFLWDIAKLVFAIAVLGGLARPEKASRVWVAGSVAATIVFVLWALRLNRGGTEHD